MFIKKKLTNIIDFVNRYAHDLPINNYEHKYHTKWHLNYKVYLFCMKIQYLYNFVDIIFNFHSLYLKEKTCLVFAVCTFIPNMIFCKLKYTSWILRSNYSHNLGPYRT